MERLAAGSVRRLATATVFSAIVLVICGSGCRKETPTAPDSNAPAGGQTSQAAAPGDVQAPHPDKIMATVNGTAIMESQVKQRVGVKYKPQLDKLAAQSPQLVAQWEKQAAQLALNELVIEQLLDKEAKEAGVEVTEEQLMAEVAKQLAAGDPPLTVEQYEKMLEGQGIDFEAWKEYYIRNMTYTKFLESKVGGGITVTEEEGQKYYDEHPDEFQVPEQVRASHILISTEATDPNADPNQMRAQAREKAEKLLTQVKEGGDFAALAKENSADHYSAIRGGELPPFGRGDMVPPFEEAAFALKVGELSDLIETQFGYHIIKVTGHTDPNTVTFPEAKDRIIGELKDRKMREAFGNYIETLRQKAAIVYADGEMPLMRPPAAGAPADADEAQARPEPVTPAADPNNG